MGIDAFAINQVPYRTSLAFAAGPAVDLCLVHQRKLETGSTCLQCQKREREMDKERDGGLSVSLSLVNAARAYLFKKCRSKLHPGLTHDHESPLMLYVCPLVLIRKTSSKAKYDSEAHPTFVSKGELKEMYDQDSDEGY